MRKSTLLNQNWQFLKGDDTSSHLKDFDSLTWDIVHLPHSMEIAPTHNSGGRNYQGVCRYRKHFTIHKEMDGEKFLLEFEGAMQVLEVWINDHQLPTHYCGYTPAVYDITPYISYDEENLIAIRLDNSDRSDVPPGKTQSLLDFTYDGGVYRNVHLHRLPAVHITNPILENKVAGGGMYISFDHVSEQKATARVQCHVRNTTDTNKELLILHELVNKNNEVVAHCSVGASLASEKDEHYVCELTVEAPQLWHPNHPYLYTLRTQVMNQDQVIDEVETSIGIRTFTFTKDDGFYINDQKLKVSGANYHQTFTQLGNAVPDSLLIRDAKKLREAGMLHLRSHYPFANSFTNACNQLGLMLTISNPGWQYFEEGPFVDRACQNLRDIVRWLRNNPSIILWEAILNETNMPESFQQRVHDIVHEEMPFGPCYTGSDSGISDVAYRNFDPGMFDPKLVDEHPEVLEQAEARLNKPKWVREYGDSPDNWFDQSCGWRVPRAWGEDLMLKQVRRMTWDKTPWFSNYTNNYNNESLCGFGMWPGIEHNRGYHMNPCYGGFLDLQRIPKYSFYFFKSQQGPDISIEGIPCGPMAYIANSWSDTSPDDITIYSNCEKMRLYHNDTLIEERLPDDLAVKHPPFTFKNNFYYGRERSEIRVEGLIDEKVVATDVRFSPGVTRELRLVPDDMGIDLKADGGDIMFVRCEAVDDQGSIVPLTCDCHDILFEVKGEGHIIGDSLKRTELGVTGILIQSTTTPGKITVTCQLKNPLKYSSIALKAGNLELYTK